MAEAKQEVQLQQAQAPEMERIRDRQVFTPDVDIYEKSDAIVLLADMPGTDETSVDISLKNRVLTITGKVDPESFKDHQLAYAEYRLGDYSRSFSLSDDVDQDRIEATVKDGLLKLALPKSEPAKAKKIQVKAS